MFNQVRTSKICPCWPVVLLFLSLMHFDKIENTKNIGIDFKALGNAKILEVGGSKRLCKNLVRS